MPFWTITVLMQVTEPVLFQSKTIVQVDISVWDLYGRNQTSSFERYDIEYQDEEVLMAFFEMYRPSEQWPNDQKRWFYPKNSLVKKIEQKIKQFWGSTSFEIKVSQHYKDFRHSVSIKIRMQRTSHWFLLQSSSKFKTTSSDNWDLERGNQVCDCGLTRVWNSRLVQKIIAGIY